MSKLIDEQIVIWYYEGNGVRFTKEMIDAQLANPNDRLHKLLSLFRNAKVDAVNDFVAKLNEQDPYTPLEGTPRQYVETTRTKFIEEIKAEG